MTKNAEAALLEDLHVVGIGASAGGLRALEEFFDHMPCNSGASFVVVQHLSPDYRSLMKELLERRTPMAVKRVTEGLPLEPNTIFLIPPGQNLVLESGHLHLSLQERDQNRQPHFPIDLFFKSLSAHKKGRTISVVLSGTGTDGTRGIQEITEQGGIILAQEPISAEFDGMPRSAIATGMVDIVLPPAELAEATYELLTSPTRWAEVHESDDIDPDQSSSELIQIRQIIDILEQHFSINFTQYKLSTITRRIQRRCLISGYQNLENYIGRLKHSDEERDALRNDLLITVTRFFRDTRAWRVLEQDVLPNLIERLVPKQALRIWVTACATGEEAYSMAILVKESLERLAPNSGIEAKIFATDIDPIAMKKASLGLYSKSTIDNLSEERITRFFKRQHGDLEVTRELREMVIFANHNLVQDAVFTNMNLVSCRNVLIYMQPELQQKVLGNLHFSLNREGILFLGESENLGGLEEEFKAVSKKWKIYQKVRNIRLSSSINNSVNFTVSDHFKRPLTPSAKAVRFDPLIETAFRLLLESTQATCFLVNRNNELIHLCGDSLGMLKLPQGRASQDIIRLVPELLQLPLSAALHQVRQKGEPIQYRGCKVQEAPDHYTVTLEVSRQPATRDVGEFSLVLIKQEENPIVAREQDSFNVDPETAQYVLQIEQELQRNRENLQATVEELETTNEEQQATNEELIASNEELQSTNEELQSVNEELYTVNAEYQGKIQELIELNNDLDNLLTNIDIGVVFLDSDLHIRKFTQAATIACNLLNTDIGRPIEHISHNLEDFGLLEAIEWVHQNQETARHGVRIKREGPYLLLRIHPYLTDIQTIEGVILTFVNVDALRETQKQLETAIVELGEKQHFLELLAQATPNSVYIYDLVEQRNIYCSRPLANLLGYSSTLLEDLSTDSNHRIFHPDDIDRIEAHHKAIIEYPDTADDTELLGPVFDIEYRVRSADGSWRWLYSQDVIFKVSVEGQPTQILGTAIDISELKATEARLKESEARYRATYQNTPTMLYSINNTGEIVSVSDYWLQIFGYEREEVIGRKPTDFLTEDSRQYADEVIFPEFFNTGICHNVACDMVCKNGSILEMLLSATAEYDAAGNFVHSLAVLVDVTERNRVEQELSDYRHHLEKLVNDHLEKLVSERTNALQDVNQQLKSEVLKHRQTQRRLIERAKALELSNADLEEFAYVISHDLQEPVRAITVFAELLKQQCSEQLNQTADTYLNNITEGGFRMKNMIDGLLAFSRTAHQGQAFEMSDFQQILDMVLRTLQSLLEEAQAIVTHDPLPSLEADGSQIAQLLQNLIGNAIKFRSDANPRIHISAFHQAADDQQSEQWVFSVCDNGMGISPQQQARIFSLFQRLHARQEIPGDGIGLSICKKIVERHRGQIWVESEQGEGATFYFTIATHLGTGQGDELQ